MMSRATKAMQEIVIFIAVESPSKSHVANGQVKQLDRGLQARNRHIKLASFWGGAPLELNVARCVRELTNLSRFLTEHYIGDHDRHCEKSSAAENVGSISSNQKQWLPLFSAPMFLTVPEQQRTTSHSVSVDASKIVLLRQELGWTQEEAARRSGYSERLIRKLEKQAKVRPQTVRDIVQCFHEALGITEWNLADFLLNPDVDEGVTSTSEEDGAFLMERMRSYYDIVYQQRCPDQIKEYVDENIRFLAEGTVRTGREAIEDRASKLLAAFNPIEFSIDKIFNQDQIVFTYWSVHMKHIGDFLDVPATNLWVDVRGHSIVQFADGVVVDAEDQFDVDDLMRQLCGQEPRVI